MHLRLWKSAKPLSRLDLCVEGVVLNFQFLCGGRELSTRRWHWSSLERSPGGVDFATFRVGRSPGDCVASLRLFSPTTSRESWKTREETIQWFRVQFMSASGAVMMHVFWHESFDSNQHYAQWTTLTNDAWISGKELQTAATNKLKHTIQELFCEMWFFSGVAWLYLRVVINLGQAWTNSSPCRANSCL